MKAPVTFDVDGTLTAEPYDESNLLTLKENPTMVILAMVLQLERPLLISTARPESLRHVTESWLNKHGIYPVEIYMRPEDKDGVPDPLIKLEHLRNMQEKHGQPMLWVDDNLANIQMLKKNQVPVIHIT